MNDESSQSLSESNGSSISSASSTVSKVSVHHEYIAALNAKSMEISKEKEREVSRSILKII